MCNDNVLAWKWNWSEFIHSNFLVLWFFFIFLFFLENTQSVLKMHNALPVLRQTARGVLLRDSWSILSLDKVVNILHVLWNFKLFYLYFFTKESKWLALNWDVYEYIFFQRWEEVIILVLKLLLNKNPTLTFDEQW